MKSTDRAPDGWDKSQDWFEEGNVLEKIVTYMRDQEHFEDIIISEEIVHQDGRVIKKHKKGPDIIAKKSGSTKIVEVKGYPAKWYVSGRNKGLLKKVKRKTEARHNFDGALSQTIQHKCKNQDSDIAIGFPECAIYMDYIGKIRWFAKQFGLSFYIVKEGGMVDLIQ